MNESCNNADATSTRYSRECYKLVVFFSGDDQSQMEFDIPVDPHDTETKLSCAQFGAQVRIR